MTLSRRARLALRLAMAVGLAIIYVPLLVVLVNSFNTSKTFAWPPQGLTLHWWSVTVGNAGARAALRTSVLVGLGATAVALVLGTMAAFAVARYRFFGRDTISFLVILPIALPGIVTGIALNSAFNARHVPFGYLTVIVGHATFCIVVVYNNVLARLRRTGSSLEEASADLGATTFQTFRLVTFPQLRSALLAGGLLAFALSFDEIVVTTFTTSPGLQTLPLWIFNNLFRPNQAPVINVVAAMLIVLSIVPIWVAQRLSGDETGGRL
ncbi:MAG: putative spermidine/putrescine transport system permease protein [Frankiaceae bacterium]|nr:putative spermidine/putrescine transport system permease protein [Frankiaceae bacterium]